MTNEQPQKREQPSASKVLTPEALFTPEKIAEMREFISQFIRDHKEWLKEMAKK